MTVAHVLVAGAEFYAAAGGLIAVVFLGLGLDRFDPAARGSYAFRLLIVPGIVALWPLVLARWWAIEQGQISKGRTP